MLRDLEMIRIFNKAFRVRKWRLSDLALIRIFIEAFRV